MTTSNEVGHSQWPFDEADYMSLRRMLPSSGALFMFEAVARHLSFTAAGHEFNVTQSAVSRVIGRLETHLGVRLFLRNPGGIELTEEGTILFKAVVSGFQQVEVALQDLRVRNGSEGIVTISVSSAFAMHWFMPRFDVFRREFPNIDLRFQLIHGEPAGPFDGVDFGIHFNTHPGPAHQSWKLIDEIVVPVCSPGYLRDHGSLDDSADLRNHTLIHLSGALRIPWYRFLSLTGYPEPQGANNLIISDYALLIQAAIKGQGLALGWWHVVANELQEIGLVRAGKRYLRTGDHYSLVATSSRPMRKSAVIVKEWLIAQMAEIEAQLSE